jgi:hypothetical protein
MCRHALKHMKEGSSIINSTSVNAYTGKAETLDYTSTKGAIVAFTRGLAQQLVNRGIRVNAVAPGPVWTPVQPATMPAEMIQNLGSDVPMKRAGQPCEIAPCYLFLASLQDSSYFTGQVLHPNGAYLCFLNSSLLCLHSKLSGFGHITHVIINVNMIWYLTLQLKGVSYINFVTYCNSNINMRWLICRWDDCECLVLACCSNCAFTCFAIKRCY